MQCTSRNALPCTLTIFFSTSRKRNENSIFPSEREIIEPFLLEIFRDRDSCQWLSYAGPSHSFPPEDENYENDMTRKWWGWWFETILAEVMVVFPRWRRIVISSDRQSSPIVHYRHTTTLQYYPLSLCCIVTLECALWDALHCILKCRALHCRTILCTALCISALSVVQSRHYLRYLERR